MLPILAVLSQVLQYLVIFMKTQFLDYMKISTCIYKKKFISSHHDYKEKLVNRYPKCTLKAQKPEDK